MKRGQFNLATLIVPMNHSSKQEPDANVATPRRIGALAVPLGIVVFCLVAFWLTTRFERVPPILKRGIQPADFPQLVLGLIMVLTITTVFTEKVKAMEKLGGRTLKTMLLFAGFAALTLIDFFLALGVFAAALAALWGERRKLMLLLVGVIIPMSVFFLFDLVFEIRFPRGLLTNLWYG